MNVRVEIGKRKIPFSAFLFQNPIDFSREEFSLSNIDNEFHSESNSRNYKHDKIKLSGIVIRKRTISPSKIG